MEHVLTTASSFLLLILFGFILKRLGFFGPHDHQLLSKLVMNLTLPAAAIVNFAPLELTPALLSLLGLGLGMNLLTALLGWGLACRGSSVQKSFALLNWSGYNMGAFAMPYLQGFLGAAGVGAACIFDVGNAIMCTGGTYALTAVLAPEEGRRHITLGEIAKKLFSSTVFDVYLLMLVMGLLRIPVPRLAVQLLSPAAAANSCIAMLTIGLMLELKLPAGSLGQSLAIILGRNLVAAAAAGAFFLLAPFSLEIRQAISISFFAPIAVASAAFSEKCGCDPGVTGFTISLSILVSLPLMTLLTILLGVR